eukprot:6764401-Pyramimonas_sp.AAC.2
MPFGGPRRLSRQASAEQPNAKIGRGAPRQTDSLGKAKTKRTSRSAACRENTTQKIAPIWPVGGWPEVPAPRRGDWARTSRAPRALNGGPPAGGR